MKKKLISLSCLLLWLGHCSFSQELDFRNGVANYTLPASPTSAQFTKYVDQPVNLYTGLPQINIPIYQIDYKDLTVPIRLSYHASGVKVEDVGSWAGNGWSLMAGGAVTRKVIDRADDNLFSVHVGNLGFDMSPYTGWLYDGSSFSFELLTNYDDGVRGDPLIESSLKDYLSALSPFPGEGTDANMNHRYRTMLGNGYDMSSDIYDYSAPGISGRFMFDKDGNIKKIPHSNHKITIIYGPNSRLFERQADQQCNLEEELTLDAEAIGLNGKIVGFDVTSDNGVIYRFRKYETTENCNGNGTNGDRLQIFPRWTGSLPFQNSLYLSRPSLAWRTQGVPGSLHNRKYISSWFLTAIVSASREDSISFSYVPETTLRLSNPVESYNINFAGNTKISKSIHVIETQRLSRIDWPNGYVLFSSGGNRLDIKPSYVAWYDTQECVDNLPDPSVNSNTKLLDKIGVYNSTGLLIKEVDFNTYYEESPGIGSLPSSDQWAYRRLFLNSVQEKYRNSNGNYSQKPPYTFEYNQTDLPSKLSAEQDIWGYYNANQSRTLIPQLYFYPSDPMDPQKASMFSALPRRTGTYVGTENIISGAGNISNEDDMFLNRSALVTGDRGSDALAAKAGVLEKIQYPTGGHVMFDYELNTFRSSKYEDFDGSLDIDGAGLRIKEITSTAEGSEPIIKRYFYDDNGASSGKILSLPEYVYFTPRATEYTISCNNLTVHDIESLGQFQSTPINGIEVSQGSYVVYGKVTEEVVGRGKTVSEYDIPVYLGIENAPAYTTTSQDFEYDRHCGNNEFQAEGGYPYPPNPSIDWTRGFLLNQTVLDENGNKISETVNTYGVSDIQTVSRGFFYRHDHPAYVTHPTPLHYRRPHYGPLIYKTGWKYLVSSERSMHSPETNSIHSVITDYTYDNLQISSESYDDNEGLSHVTTFKYPISSGLPITVPQEMVNRNLISIPVSQGYARDGVLIEEINNHFVFDGISNTIQLDHSEHFKRGEALPDVLYKYDTDGNVVSYETQGNISTSMLRGYHNQYVIASVENAEPDEIAYTSFEDGLDPGNWSVSPGVNYVGDPYTGKYSMTNGWVNTDNLPLGDYELSYWKKGNPVVTLSGQDPGVTSTTEEALSSGWTKVVMNFKLINNTNLVQLQSFSNNEIVDELRLYPQDALMTSNSYEPAVGMLSTTDPKGITQKFEYKLGQLSTVRDQEDYIIQSTRLKYADSYVTTNSLDFGLISTVNDGLAVRDFTIVNNSTEEVTVYSPVILGSGTFSTNWTTGVIPEGASQNFQVTYQPTAAGSHVGEMKIRFNTEEADRLIPLQGQATTEWSAISQPEAGDSFDQGNNIQIHWTCSCSHVRLEYMGEEETSGPVIVTSTNNSPYLWDPPALAFGDYRIKITNLNTGLSTYSGSFEID
ncbi:MAG: hypothetical protein KI790_10995 [Cyclobacteriaceae bacterium]|nr:hypothetical protein [Cyclobacteriaceae bacterium HetDA_MAG_MS6]